MWQIDWHVAVALIVTFLILTVAVWKVWVAVREMRTILQDFDEPDITNEKFVKRCTNFAMMCSLVYAAVFPHRRYGWDKQNFIHDSHGRRFCRVLSNEEEVLVVFPGTRWVRRNRLWWRTRLEFIDVFTHLKFWLCELRRVRKRRKVRRGSVHLGWRDALNCENAMTGARCWDEIVKYISDAKAGKKKQIFFSGHSLGGALAVLAAERYAREHDGNIAGVYTFGQPAVGDRVFRRQYKRLHDVTYRFCCGIDIVTFLPPIMYRHVGREYWLHRGKIWKPTSWLIRLAGILYEIPFPRAHHFMIPFPIAHHFMRKYILALEGSEGWRQFIKGIKDERKARSLLAKARKAAQENRRQDAENYANRAIATAPDSDVAVDARKLIGEITWIKFKCFCGKRWRILGKFAGRRVRCKTCSQTLTVPSAAAAAASTNAVGATSTTVLS